MFAKKSGIGHKGLPFHCPHTEVDLKAIYQALDNRLKKGASFLDLGCGKGQLLSLLVERFEGQGLGIDTNAESLARVRDPVSGSVNTLCEDMNVWIENNRVEKISFDVIICIGSLCSGQQEEMIRTLSTFVSAGGFLIIGELAWVNEPSEQFLEFLGMKKSDYTSPKELTESVIQSGFSEIRHQSLCSLEVYECAIHRNVEEWAVANKDDPDCDQILEMSTTWFNFSRDHAWNTWHFATIIAQRP
jgi:SAM-dependent methyltransferase